MTDAAAGLHRQCRLPDAFENARKVVGDLTEYEAVEKRDVAVGPGSGKNATRRLKSEIRHRVIKRASPLLSGTLAALFDRRRSQRDAPKRIFHRLIGRDGCRARKAILAPPNRVGNCGQI